MCYSSYVTNKKSSWKMLCEYLQQTVWTSSSACVFIPHWLLCYFCTSLLSFVALIDIFLSFFFFFWKDKECLYVRTCLTSEAHSHSNLVYYWTNHHFWLCTQQPLLVVAIHNILRNSSQYGILFLLWDTQYLWRNRENYICIHPAPSHLN